MAARIVQEPKCPPSVGCCACAGRDECMNCASCGAGWCLSGSDGLPTGETQWGEPHIDLWRRLRAEHGITTPEPKE